MNEKLPHSRPRASRWPIRLATLCFQAATLGTAFVLTVGAGSPGDSSVADTVDIAGSIVVPPAGQGEVLPAVEQPFREGEYLKFSVKYGFVSAGSAYLEVPKTEDVNGKIALVLQARAESNAFFSRFYKVRNTIRSVWDRDGRYSHRFTENRREGGYKAQTDIEFDYDRLEARYRDGKTYPVPPHVQDALSSFYYARTQALPLGGSIVFDYHASRKSLPLEVRVLGRERVETPAGRFDCVAIEPMLKAGGIFKNKGRLVIWITDDERRMPVMLRSKVTVGSISVVLQEFRTS